MNALQTEDLDGRDEQDLTRLMNASRIHSEQTVRALLEAKASANISNNHGDTALMFASGFSSNMTIVKQLLDAKANVNSRTKQGVTALMAASEYGGRENENIVRHLIAHKALVSFSDEDGNTALTIVLAQGRRREEFFDLLSRTYITEILPVLLEALPFPVAGGHDALHKLIASYAAS